MLARMLLISARMLSGSPNSSRIYASAEMYDDDDAPSQHYYKNDTIISTVSIRVTPRYNHMVSWLVLWVGFILTACLVFWQICIERRRDDVSTADENRTIFRRLLLAAIMSRIILMPIQIYIDPIWWQFFGDTLPEMIFASAWCLLVGFFVQLVGIATGQGTSTSPGVVIQATAYVVYIVLMILQIWNNVASVLLYALLCCIYAALFGIVLYFFPKLLGILKPSLARHGGLALRLSISTIMCIVLFAAHTIGYARMVVAPPRNVYWWWMYGALELLPSVVFLTLIHPSQNKDDTQGGVIPEDNTVQRTRASNMRRVDSGNSNAVAAALPTVTRKGNNNINSSTATATAGNNSESASLLKTSIGYGSTDGPK